MERPGVSEQAVIDGFHALQAASLSIALDRGWLNDDDLAARADIVVSGPALTLLLAAIRAHDAEIEIPVEGATIRLSAASCPDTLRPLYDAWAELLPRVRQYGQLGTLCRLVVDRPVADANAEGRAIAAGLRQLGIGIAQRRTFNARLRDDLQSAFDSQAEGSGHTAPRSDFEPPPRYSTSESTGDASEMASSVRETLYAALTEVLSPVLVRRLQSSSSKRDAYFAAIALSILLVATTSVDLKTASIRLVGPVHSIDEMISPEHLRPLVRGLLGTAKLAQAAADEDDQAAIRRAQDGQEDIEPSLAVLRRALETGAEVDPSPLYQTISTLALAVLSLPDFVARQDEVFAALAGSPR